MTLLYMITFSNHYKTLGVCPLLDGWIYTVGGMSLSKSLVQEIVAFLCSYSLSTLLVIMNLVSQWNFVSTKKLSGCISIPQSCIEYAISIIIFFHTFSVIHLCDCLWLILWLFVEMSIFEWLKQPTLHIYSPMYLCIISAENITKWLVQKIFCFLRGHVTSNCYI